MSKPKRVVSLVPSWTESLIEAGMQPVGRTRYCIYPEALVKRIPAVGGTKRVNWNRIRELEPDLLILDKEENPKSFAESAGCEFWASHVQTASDLPVQLQALADLLGNDLLAQMAREWKAVLAKPLAFELDRPPALLQWVKRPRQGIKKIVYLIWKNPWMTVSKDTFIGSMLIHSGAEAFLPDHGQKYPELELSDFNREDCLVLLSTEPYPFEKNLAEFEALNCASALVDGGKLSWFGVRSLRYLQSL